MDKIYTIQDLQAKYGVSRQTLQRYIANGELHGTMEGNKWTFSETDLKEFEKMKGTKPIEIYKELLPGGELCKGNNLYKIVSIFPEGCTVIDQSTQATIFVSMEAIKYFTIL